MPTTPQAQMPETVRAKRVAFKEVEWLWRPYVARGMITAIGGVPGEGKSMLTCRLAADASHKGTVIMSNSEDDYGLTVRPRLEAAGANMDNIIFLNPSPILPGVVNDAHPRGSQTEYLLREIDRAKAVLVILDPLQDHLEVSVFSPKVTHILAPLAKEIAKRGTAVVIVSHVVKSMPKGAHPLFAFGGTAGGITRVARLCFIFGRHPFDSAKRVLAFAKGNIIPDDEKVSAVFLMASKETRTGQGRNAKVLSPGVLRFTETDEAITASMIIRPDAARIGEASMGGDKKNQAAQWLTDLLTGSPDHRLPSKEIERQAKEVGITWATLRRADDEVVGTIKKRLPGIKGKAGSGGIAWQLPTV